MANFTLIRGGQLISGQVAGGQIVGGYATYALALAASTANDIITIQPGTYPDAIGFPHSLTVVGAVPGQYATVAGCGDANASPGITVWVENLRVYGNKNIDCTPSGGRCFGMMFGNAKSLTINKCLLEECAIGVQTIAYIGNVLIQDTEFKNCGQVSAPNCHSIYAALGFSGAKPLNPNNSLTLRGCYFHFTYDYTNAPGGQVWRVGIGHYIKSDLAQLVVEGCYFKTGISPAGSTTCKIQGDLGGKWIIRGNIIEEGPRSGYDPTDSGSGVVPYGPYQPNAVPPGVQADNKIIGWASIPPNAATGAFGTPWPNSEVHILQNTIINDGKASEQLISYDPRSVPARPPVLEVKDNVIIRGSGLADLAISSWASDGSNSIFNDKSVMVDAAAENFRLLAPVQGSKNWTAYQFSFPLGHSARTDSLRGGVGGVGGLSQGPLWMLNAAGPNQMLPLLTWYKIPGSDLRTQAANYPFNLLRPDRDPSNTSSFGPSGQGLLDLPGKVASFCGAALRSNGSYLIVGPGGGRSSSWNNDVATFQLSADAPVWHTELPSTVWKDINYQNMLTPSPGVPGWPSGLYGTAAYNDGRPVAVQTGYSLLFIDAINALTVGGGTPVPGGSGGDTAMWVWGELSWKVPGSIKPAIPINLPLPGYNASSCVDQTTGQVYIASNSSLCRWTPSATGRGMYEHLFDYNGGQRPQFTARWVPSCFDTKRKRWVCIGQSAPTGTVATTYMFAEVNNLAAGMQVAPVTGGAAKSRIDNSRACSSLVYVPDLPGGGGDYYVWWARWLASSSPAPSANQNYPVRIDPVTWVATDLVVSNSLSNTPGDAATGTWNRLQYVPALKILAYVNGDSKTPDYGVYVIRLG